ncbi:multidrug transporter [Azospirillum sp. TSH100]|uniref:MATE family efflux transporter n=1 Tax=Azospirillum sp. TSH100 TaxID=652764 RepID=UPI000D622E2D|nr:MATE family efflux transporter [Azospirillum sp. TSH100]PWC91349.1 multidrug transporter [Azospirillum sp. TSH100]QCG89229.1 MATE family efflux transporter [Azospirillum sp. TSH100]
MRSRFHPYRDIVALSAPIAGIQFAQVALTSTDLLMMGLLGVQAVAAGGLAMLLHNQLRTMCVGMVTGVGNLVAAAAGRGETRNGARELDDTARGEVRALLRSALLVATLTATAAALLLVLASRLLPLLGQTPEVAAQAQGIMLTLAPGLLPMLWLNVLRQFAVGMRRAGSLLRVTLISIAVNALLNALFIHGWLGLPRLGLAGIGLSTTLVQLWTFLVYLRTVGRDPLLGPLLALDAWRADRAAVRTITGMGTPIALTYGSEAAITSIASLFMGSFGAVALAASNIVNQLAYIVYQVNIGLSQGSSILVSRAIGKGQGHEVADIARRAMTIALSIMTAVGLLYALVPSAVLRPFLGGGADPAVIATATTLLWFAIAHQYFKGSQNVCVGLLRGLGNTRAGLTGTLIGYWLIGIPAMALCAYPLGLGGYGVWFGLCLGFGATSLLLWRRFLLDLRPLTGTATPPLVSKEAR